MLMRSKFNSTVKLEISCTSVHSKSNYNTYPASECSEQSLSLSFNRLVFAILKSTSETEIEGEQIFLYIGQTEREKLEAVHPAHGGTSCRLKSSTVPIQELSPASSLILVQSLSFSTQLRAIERC